MRLHWPYAAGLGRARARNALARRAPQRRPQRALLASDRVLHGVILPAHRVASHRLPHFDTIDSRRQAPRPAEFAACAREEVPGCQLREPPLPTCEVVGAGGMLVAL